MDFLDVYAELAAELPPLQVYMTWADGEVESVNVRDGHCVTVIDDAMLARVWG